MILRSNTEQVNSIMMLMVFPEIPLPQQEIFPDMVRAISNAALVMDHPLAENCVIRKSLKPTDESKSEFCYQEMDSVN